MRDLYPEIEPLETGMLDERVVTARHQHLIDHPVPHAHQARREPICIS